MRNSSHPDTSYLQKYLDHQPLAKDVTHHIEACATCQEQLRMMQREKELLQHMFAALPNIPDQTDKIMRQIRKLPQTASDMSSDLPRLTLIPILLTILGIAQLIYLVAIQPTWYENLILFFDHVFTLISTLLIVNRAGIYLSFTPSPSYLVIGMTFLVLLLAINLLLKKRGYQNANKTI